MPYVPTNCWPHNCAVERKLDGYHFLGTVDKYDEIEDVHLNLYDENDYKNPVVTVYNKDKKIVDMVGNEFKLTESSNPNYNISNQTIDLKVIPQFSENNNYIVDNIRFDVNKSVSKETIDGEPRDYYIHYIIKFDIKEFETKEIVLEDQFIDFKFTFDSRNWTRNGGSSNLKVGVVYEASEFLGKAPSIGFTTSYNDKSVNVDKVIKYTTNQCSVMRPDRYHSYYYITLNTFSPTIDVRNLKIFYPIGEEIVTVLVNLLITLRFSGNLFTIFRNNDYGPYLDDYSTTPSYTTTSSKYVINIANNKQDLGQFLTTTNKLDWNFILFGNKYDKFIGDGVLELTDGLISTYFLIPPSEFIETGQQINDLYYLKIIDKTEYLDEIGLCTVEQTYTSANTNPYSYKIIFNASMKDNIFQPNPDTATASANYTNTNELSFYIGTQQFKASDLTLVSGSGWTQFTLPASKTPLLVAEKTISQQIVYEFLRENTRIELYPSLEFKEEEKIDSTMFSDLNYVIKSNKIVSPMFSASVIESSQLPISITPNNKNIEIKSSRIEDLLKYKIKIYKNEVLEFETPFIFNPLVDYIYKYALPNETYKIEVQCYFKYNFEKTFTKIITIPEYQVQSNKILVEYDSSLKANTLFISNIFSNPWIDSKGRIWRKNESGYWYNDSDILFDINEQIIQELRASIYRYKLKDNNELIEQLLLADDINIKPHWTEENMTFNCNFNDCGIDGYNKYQYEIFYEADILTKLEYKTTDNKHIKYFYINNSIQGFELYFNDVKREETISFDDENNVGTVTISTVIYTFQLDEKGRLISWRSGDIERDIEIINEDSLKTEVLAIVSSEIVFNSDWIGTCLYGTEYNAEGRYEVDKDQIWYFDLDTKVDTINFTNERNVFTNANTLPKIGKSNVNYMSQSITTKLGYLNDEDVYVEDNGEKLNKFAKFANDETVKILRLPNGFLIPVDIQLKSNTTNFALSANPSDISFDWTQIGDHRNAVLYSLEQGE